MSLLSKLQSRNLGIIELLLMGFDIYLKNLKSTLLVYGTILLPISIVFVTLSFLLQTKPSGLFLVSFYVVFLIFSLFQLIYQIAISVMVENYVHGKNTSYQSILRKISATFTSLFLLGFRFGINFYLRAFLLFIPGAIYFVNNQYFGLAYILRDQDGKAAFAYSRSIVKGNLRQVCYFNCLIFPIIFVIQIIGNAFLKNIPFVNDFWIQMLSQIFPSIVGIGIGIAGILLFLNLDYQKSLKS